MKMQILEIDCMGNIQLYIETTSLAEATDIMIHSTDRRWWFKEGTERAGVFSAYVWVDGGTGNGSQLSGIDKLKKRGWMWNSQKK